ncbi:phosphatase and actin regulator 4A-like [Eucalyptus grandis]|uniref:phosphatase and actin regulator 4A-like n=1 Tax=Eucalyptus grandis TaxID=71139 RepID=UPI00192ECE66|nr:phosphatase and actin regulator 4A-like [Eucalyptus grandis]
MKKKKERLESIENFESLLAFQPLPSYSHQPPPSPPRVFPTLFASKKGKTKEALSAPPPVPPPPAALRKTRAKPDAVSQSTANLIAIKKSHAPVTMTPNYDESSDDSGTSSPSTPMPPPRPPFEVPSWTFAMSGHHVQIKSPNAQRHKSPDTEDDEDSISETIESASNASSEATSLLFSPSPDVNERAGKFIATFKAWLNQEKTNSTKRRRSNLGPEIIA